MADGGLAPGQEPESVSREAAELVALIDRLEELLERSSLSELEVEAAGTAIILRKPGALARSVETAPVAAEAPVGAPSPAARHSEPAGTEPSSLRAIVAPLTGVFYLSPSPGATPYVRVGGDVSAGQVIGLIEAMKLFNEIKSDISGVVRRIAVVGGALVKARQTLIEVEPA